jgi:DNA-binding CsgD family transcriptional regulator
MMTVTALPTTTPRDTTPADSHSEAIPTLTAEPADRALLRQHVIGALRAMLDQVELHAINATTTVNGVSVVLEHNNVRCVLVVSPQVPRRALSPREVEIARLVAAGATNRAIASSLDISLWTVSTHMRRIFAKLDVCSRAEMVAQLFGAVGDIPGRSLRRGELLA